MKRRRPLRATITLTAALLLLVIGLRGLYPRFLAHHWRQQLETVPDDRAATLVRAIAQLDEPGIPVLVDALGSDRETVARSGKRAILEEMERWETLRAREYSPKVAILADALADRVGRFGPVARADAADLAARILRLWTLDETVVDPMEVIASCERVLRAASPRARSRPVEGPSQASEYAATGEPPGEAVPGDPRSVHGSGADGLPDEVGPLAGLSNLPGGRLPIELVEPGELLPGESHGDSRQAEGASDEPTLADSTRPPGLLRQPQPRFAGRGPGAGALAPGTGLDELQPTNPSPLPVPGTFGRAPAPLGGSANADDDAGRMAAADTVELMRRLHAADARTVASARADLARRGFTPLHLKLAGQMFDPDPRVRTALVRLLPNLTEVDAAAWLLELSRDEDPEVRRLAIAVIATTGDPAVLDAVETIAREDPDPGVRRQAERIAQQRQPARY
jgi:hypothetical protein